MRRYCILVLLLALHFSHAEEPTCITLPSAHVVLQLPTGWTIKERGEEIGIYSPDQPEKGLPNRVHLSEYLYPEKTLQEAIEAEINRITARSPKWGSSNDLSNYKGSTPIQTKSGMAGLRANFYIELEKDGSKERQYSIVKYYFFDKAGKIFRVCAHVYGDESRFRTYDEVIIEGLCLKNEE